MRAACTLCVFLLVAPLLMGQPAPASVEGQVINGATGAPIAKAGVTLQNLAGAGSQLAISDATGHFAFTGVTAGNYFVTATHQSFTPAAPGGRNAGPQHLKISEGQKADGITVRLWPLGVITGKVTNEEGEPLRNVGLQSLQYDYGIQGRHLIGRRGVSTNDLGQFRLFDLPPGRYYVLVFARHTRPALSGRTHSDVPEEAYASVFYPAASDASQAGAIDVAPGVEISGIDLKLRRIAAYHVHGIAVDSNKRPVRGVIVVTKCDESFGFGQTVQSTAGLRQDGQFELAGVPQGTYCLRLDTGGRLPLYASQSVTVREQDVDGIVVTARPLVEVHGSVVLADGANSANPAAIHVSLEPIDQRPPATQSPTAADGTFAFSGVVPGQYQVVVQPPVQGVYVKSIQFGNQEVPSGRMTVGDGGGTLAIAIASGGGQVSGRVKTADGGPATNLTVALVPPDEMASRADLLVFRGVDGNGGFQLASVAPGNYRVSAFPKDYLNWMRSPEFRKQLEDRGVPVTVQEGGSVQVDVTAISPDELESVRSKLP